MNKSLTLILTLIIFSFGCVQSQNKSEFEKNGVKIKFTTTQLGTIEDDKFELIRDMNIDGVFVFIPDKKSIVLRHSNGNDELLPINSTKVTMEGNYLFECTKQRILFVSSSEKMVTYSIEGDSTMFVFPLDANDVEKLKKILQEFKPI